VGYEVWIFLFFCFGPGVGGGVIFDHFKPEQELISSVDDKVSSQRW